MPKVDERADQGVVAALCWSGSRYKYVAGQRGPSAQALTWYGSAMIFRYSYMAGCRRAGNSTKEQIVCVSENAETSLYTTDFEKVPEECGLSYGCAASGPGKQEK